MTSGSAHLSVGLRGHLCVFFGDTSPRILCSFLNGVVCLSVGSREFSVYSGYKSLIGFEVGRYFLPFRGRPSLPRWRRHRSSCFEGVDRCPFLRSRLSRCRVSRVFPGPRPRRVSPRFSSKSFAVSALVLWCTVRFEYVSCAVRGRAPAHSSAGGSPGAPAPFVDGRPVPHGFALVLSWKVVNAQADFWTPSSVLLLVRLPGGYTTQAGSLRF